MSEQSKIQWTDSTINFWSGCTKVSDGCKHCYAEARDARQMQEKKSHWGKGAPRLKTKGAVKDALAFNRKPWICDKCGNAEMHKTPAERFYGCQKCKCLTQHRRRIFSLSLGDWLDEEVPIEWLAEMLDTIRQCDQVTWILCTKRPELFFKRLEASHYHLCKTQPHISAKEQVATSRWISTWIDGDAPKNIILLTSVENQEQADKRIPELLKIPAACRGLSVEPMLGQIDFRSAAFNGADSINSIAGINWMIFGGESGPAARPCNVEWIRSGMKQCKAAGVPVFVKQLGSNVRVEHNDEPYHDKKGGDMSEWPKDIRVREFPAKANV